jgi:glycosyltransferase involved in cell wall biosynthesis
LSRLEDDAAPGHFGNHPCSNVGRQLLTQSMTSAPAVSIVIPCRDQARYLVAALESVGRQTFASVETIVVDDGSSDETAAVAESAGAVVLRQRHAGVSTARNHGLAAARGLYVVFLDADDELEPDAIESGVSALERSPDAWMVARSCVLTDPEGAALPTNCPAPEAGDLYGQWLERNLVWTPGAVMFRRTPLVALGGFPPSIGPAADYAVYLELARSGRVIFDQRVAVRYRQHDANMSRDPIRMLQATLAVLRREEPRVPAQYREHFKRGRLDWCTFYGEQIIQQLRMDSRRRRLGSADVRAVALLLKECRGLVFTHLTRKLRRLAAGQPRAEVETGRFAPPTGQSGEAADIRSTRTAP